MTTVFQRVGPYEILREIGRGGMAAVFLADDARHGRQVALKLVPIGEDREAKEILDAERWGARLQAKFAEACALVPRVYEDGDEPPYYFIAMEYVRGENLSDIIARGPVAPSEGARRTCAESISSRGAPVQSVDRWARILVARPRRLETAERSHCRRRIHQGARFRHRESVVGQPQSHP